MCRQSHDTPWCVCSLVVVFLRCRRTWQRQQLVADPCLLTQEQTGGPSTHALMAVCQTLDNRMQDCKVPVRTQGHHLIPNSTSLRGPSSMFLHHHQHHPFSSTSGPCPSITIPLLVSQAWVSISAVFKNLLHTEESFMGFNDCSLKRWDGVSAYSKYEIVEFDGNTASEST